MRTLTIIILSILISSNVFAGSEDYDTTKTEEEILKSKANFYFGLGNASTSTNSLEALTFHFQKHIFPHVEFGPQVAYYFNIDQMNNPGGIRLGFDFKFNLTDNMKKTDMFFLIGIESLTRIFDKDNAAISFGLGIESPAYKRIQFFGLFETTNSTSLSDNYLQTFSVGIKFLNPLLTKEDNVLWTSK